MAKLEQVSINQLELFSLTEETTQTTYHGFDQEWYSKKWRRMAGCGPTTASHIVYYLQKTRDVFPPKLQWLQKGDSLSLMDIMWDYVTPTMQGVNKTEILERGLIKFASSHGNTLKTRSIIVPKAKGQRPVLSLLAAFLKQGLHEDIPVAFLNWHQGECKNLEGWHWVTIVAVNWNEATSNLFVSILDGGEHKQIDLSLWHRTTKLGGGFVSFELSE